jgi:hypothetical protein
MTVTLFRPVGLHELALIWDAGMKAFPPRLPHQPIFYPVANIDYATQIAWDWNPKDEASGFAGYVTQFVVPEAYLQKFEPRRVGASVHLEYWIPAEQLEEFNASIEGLISVEAAYFGAAYKGFVPEQFGLKGRDAVRQFVTMSSLWDYSSFDFVCEVSANRKAMFLNFLFWSQFDFTSFGVTQKQRDDTIGRIRDAWTFNEIQVPLPTLQ